MSGTTRPKERLHCSRKIIETLRDIDVPMDCVDHKPPGLWYAIGNAWIDWCRENDCEHWINGTRGYLIDVSGARMLRLRTPQAIRRFAREFSFQGHTSRIVWPCVAMAYDGIEIAPYQWTCRLDSAAGFYYSWDCASGVIWNATKARIVPSPLTLPDASMRTAATIEREDTSCSR